MKLGDWLFKWGDMICGILIVIGIFCIVLMFVSIVHPQKQTADGHCFSWNSLEDITPPSAEWYNTRCNDWKNWNYSMANASIQATCHCYEASKGVP